MTNPYELCENIPQQHAVLFPLATPESQMFKLEEEVGDVWIDKFKNRMFVCYSDKTTTAFNIMFRINQGLDKYTVLTKEFIKEYTYLGKSKANINDLFKTENEE